MISIVTYGCIQGVCPDDFNNSKDICSRQRLLFCGAIILDIGIFAALVLGFALGWYDNAFLRAHLPRFFSETMPSTFTPVGAGMLFTGLPLAIVTGVLAYKACRLPPPPPGGPQTQAATLDNRCHLAWLRCTVFCSKQEQEPEHVAHSNANQVDAAPVSFWQRVFCCKKAKSINLEPHPLMGPNLGQPQAIPAIASEANAHMFN